MFVCNRKKKKEKKAETNYRLATLREPQHTACVLFFMTFVSQITSLLQKNPPLECSLVKGVCTVTIKGVFRGHDEIPKQNLN